MPPPRIRYGKYDAAASRGPIRAHRSQCSAFFYIPLYSASAPSQMAISEGQTWRRFQTFQSTIRAFCGLWEQQLSPRCSRYLWLDRFERGTRSPEDRSPGRASADSRRIGPLSARQGERHRWYFASLSTASLVDDLSCLESRWAKKRRPSPTFDLEKE